MTSTDIGAIAGSAATAIAPSSHPHGHAHRSGAHDYARNPMLVYWETTQACALACKHCRAEAVSTPDPNELTHAEGINLLQQIASFDRPPHMVLTGGDPLKRADLYELIDEAHRLGLSVSVTPSATGDLTYEVLAKLKAHGIESLGLSLDGSTAARHEAVRGVEGCFDWTIGAAKNAERLGIPIQINTLVSQETEGDLPAIYERLKDFAVMRWSMFFLIAVGRGKLLQPVTAQRGEEIMRWAYNLSQESPFVVATTEAPSYRRVALEQMRAKGWTGKQIEQAPISRGFEIRDGNGILFISNTGDVCPAGFLPLAAGNVRKDKLVDVYRDSPLFRELHSPIHFKGRCGVCEYHTLCGGSRARAFAYTGDPLESDPLCAHEPKAKPE
jgi:radical SAM protein